MNKKVISYIIFVIILILINTIAIFMMYEPKIDVYVSTHTLDELKKIEVEDISTIAIPKRLYHEQMITNQAELLGYYVKNDFTMVKDTIIFKDYIEDEASMNDYIHRKLSLNEVNYDLYIDELKGNINHLDEDILIDLYLTIKAKDGTIDSDLLLSNVKINAIYDSDGYKIKDQRNKKAMTISINIHKSHINILNKAINVGELSFVVTKDAYSDNKCKLNEESSVMKFLN